MSIDGEKEVIEVSELRNRLKVFRDREHAGGAIGSMTIGMMCRVTLGHTGRDKIATDLTKLSFFLMQGAAFMRVFGLMVAPDYSIEWIIGSATLWALCFALYILIYAPMLWKPDLDEAESVN